MPYEIADDRYHGTMGGGAKQDTLSTCGKAMVEDKAEIPIMDSESRDRRSRARQLETPDTREANPGGVYAIRTKTTTDHEESVAMDKDKKWKDVSTCLPNLLPRSWQSCPSAHVNP